MSTTAAGRHLVDHRVAGRRDPRTGALKLSRNFGKEAALTAGLDAVMADAAVVIDADLQDPPELIPALVEQWRPATTWSMPRAARAKAKAASSGSPRRRSIAAWSELSDTAIPRDTGDFRSALAARTGRAGTTA
jgi:glycosyltransferase involved in cell wall biosynthesis